MGYVALASAAMQAAGAAYNMIDQSKTNAAVSKIGSRARKQVKQNTAEAMGEWNGALDKLTPQQQEALAQADADKRMQSYDAATADVPEATNVMHSATGAPALVKTDAAKKLGDQLAQMKSMMQARSRLGGWDDRGLENNIMLN